MSVPCTPAPAQTLVVFVEGRISIRKKNMCVPLYARPFDVISSSCCELVVSNGIGSSCHFRCCQHQRCRWRWLQARPCLHWHWCSCQHDEVLPCQKSRSDDTPPHHFNVTRGCISPRVGIMKIKEFHTLYACPLVVVLSMVLWLLLNDVAVAIQRDKGVYLLTMLKSRN